MTTTYSTGRVQRRIQGLSIALALVVATMFCAAQAEAFCVYNRTDETIRVKQVSGSYIGRGMNVRIKPGKHKCCNWKNESCNTGGKKTSKVKFTVEFGDPVKCQMVPFGVICPPGQESTIITICKKKSVKAGGWLSVRGKSPDGRCVARY